MRTKKTIETPSLNDADTYGKQYAEAAASLKKTEGAMEAEIHAVRTRYAQGIADLKALQAEAFERLQRIAESVPEQFSEKKSLNLAHCTIGFRTGTPKVVLLKGWKLDTSLPMLKKYLPDYVRTKEEANKEALIADRDNKEVSKLFPKCGIEIKQEETFYVEAKVEDIQ